MDRRTFLHDASALSALAALGIPVFSEATSDSAADDRRLFFKKSDLPRIVQNATEGPMAATFDKWRKPNPIDVLDELRGSIRSGDLLYAFGTALTAMQEQTLVYLVTKEAEREDVLLAAIEELTEMQHWDYMRDGGTAVLGLMRASRATSMILFAREALGERVPAELDRLILESVAEKGCVPLNLTISQMDDPSTVAGWGVDKSYVDIYPYDMTRWPVILGHINLRAVPTMGLGLGALVLEAHDPRASKWLARAESSAKFFLGLFEKDGSYSEGLSYVDYAFRTLFLFLEAHYRLKGTIDWVDEANFKGITEFIVGSQAGRRQDTGEPDIVNISDSRNSVTFCVPAWIAGRGRDRLAQYAASHFARSGYFADFLWHAQGRSESGPPASLKNRRFENGWIVTRTGWGPDDTVIGFRGGGPQNHEHADRNSIFLKAFGERLITEHERASYDPRHERWLLRLPEAHNLLLIDGRGHQYVDGSEGTNSSEAVAETLRYVDRGEFVWWTSDATQAYRLLHKGVERVIRSVLFAKPDLLVILDTARRAGTPSRFSVRLFPDNRDGRAMIETRSDGSFLVGRPRATLVATCTGSSNLSLRTAQLQLSEESGRFPFVEIVSDQTESVSILTALKISGGDSKIGVVPSVLVDRDGWTVQDGARRIRVTNPNDVPGFACAA